MEDCWGEWNVRLVSCYRPDSEIGRAPLLRELLNSKVMATDVEYFQGVAENPPCRPEERPARSCVRLVGIILKHIRIRAKRHSMNKGRTFLGDQDSGQIETGATTHEPFADKGKGEGERGGGRNGEGRKEQTIGNSHARKQGAPNETRTGESCQYRKIGRCDCRQERRQTQAGSEAEGQCTFTIRRPCCSCRGEQTYRGSIDYA